MALSLKNPMVEALVAQVVSLTGESKTEAVRRALLDRVERLQMQQPVSRREQRLRAYLNEELWPEIPASEFGRTLSREEEAEILGYDEDTA